MGKIWMPGGGGGGASSDDCTLMRAAVPKGLTAVTADSDDEALEGTLDTDTTLADSQALSGQTFLKWNPQTKLFEKHTGGMANKGAWTGSVAMNGSITIPAGFHNGSGNVKGPVITNRGNYGGTGNSRGNDTSGKRMWVKVPGGYYNENAQVFLNWSDICSMAGLTADKLKKDVSIMGITGTFEGFIPGPYDVYNRGSWGTGYGTKSIFGSSPTFELSNIFISSKDSSGFMIFISKQGSDIVMQPYRTINIVFDSDLGAFPDVNVIELSVGNMSISTTPSKTEKTISLDITGINSAENITFSGGGRNGSTYCNIYRIYFT